MFSVMRAAKSPKSKTQIMYRANLTHGSLERYLKLLVDRGLLRVLEEKQSKAKRLFVTTDKGLSFLKAYRSLEEILRQKPF